MAIAAAAIPLLAAAIPAVVNAFSKKDTPASVPAAELPGLLAQATAAQSGRLPPVDYGVGSGGVKIPGMSPALAPGQLLVTPDGTIASASTTGIKPNVLTEQQSQALNTLAQQQQTAPMREDQRRVARTLSRQIRDELQPDLERIRRAQEYQQIQTRATAEHRRIEQRQQFEADVRARLQSLLADHESQSKQLNAIAKRVDGIGSAWFRF